MMGLVQEIGPRRLELTAEIERLAAVYIAKAVLPSKSSADALHIAYATVNEMDYLLSWNFRHLANSKRKARVTAVNIEEGYKFPTVITTPLEVLDAE